jgi:hypothetical protein
MVDKIFNFNSWFVNFLILKYPMRINVAIAIAGTLDPEIPPLDLLCQLLSSLQLVFQQNRRKFWAYQ